MILVSTIGFSGPDLVVWSATNLDIALWTLPEYTPPSQNIPPPLSTTICDTHIIYPFPRILYFSFQQLYATPRESTPPSWNIPHPSFFTIISDIPRIYPSVTKYAPFSGYMFL